MLPVVYSDAFCTVDVPQQEGSRIKHVKGAGGRTPKRPKTVPSTSRELNHAGSAIVDAAEIGSL